MQQDREVTSNVTAVASDGRRLFDPAGLLLVVIVGTGGILTLLKHVWIVAIPCIVLAVLGLIASHKHFDRPTEA
jgi:hypothetical protein